MSNNSTSALPEELDIRKLLAELDIPFSTRSSSLARHQHFERQKAGANRAIRRSARLYRPPKRAPLTPGLDARLPGRNHEQYHSGKEG